MHGMTPPPRADRFPCVPRELADVIERCLAKRPEDRFQSASELELQLRHHDLVHALQRELAYPGLRSGGHEFVDQPPVATLIPVADPGSNSVPSRNSGSGSDRQSARGSLSTISRPGHRNTRKALRNRPTGSFSAAVAPSKGGYRRPASLRSPCYLSESGSS